MDAALTRTAREQQKTTRLEDRLQKLRQELRAVREECAQFRNAAAQLAEDVEVGLVLLVQARWCRIPLLCPVLALTLCAGRAWHYCSCKRQLMVSLLNIEALADISTFPRHVYG